MQGTKNIGKLKSLSEVYQISSSSMRKSKILYRLSHSENLRIQGHKKKGFDNFKFQVSTFTKKRYEMSYENFIFY